MSADFKLEEVIDMVTAPIFPNGEEWEKIILNLKKRQEEEFKKLLGVFDKSFKGMIE